MIVGCLVVLLAATGAAAVFTLEEVHNLRDALNLSKPIAIAPNSLANAGWGDPQTLLLVGNDQRNHTTTSPVLPHSNEMLLVRLDPNKPWISMMSLPRELMVPIHTSFGLQTTRLNAALTFGGIPLLVKTIKQVTGLSVNHVVEIDFNNFVRAVDEIGCVYSTVDTRYYHVNVPGGPQYQQVNLQPGYQRLCGNEALQFVSYRHNDSSVVRDARDQSFLLDVKRQFGPTLIGNASEFERIFGQNVQTDVGLHNTNGILNLLGTLISSVSKPVRQVQFQVTLQPIGANACSCDTASPQQIHASVHSFLYGANHAPKAHTVAVAKTVHSGKAIKRLPLAPVPSSELARAKGMAANVLFPVQYPRVQITGGTGTPAYLLNYVIHGPQHYNYPAYVAVFSTGQLGQYYDVQGTPWTNQPQLGSADQSVTVGGRTYSLFYSGQHIRIVSWYGHDSAGRSDVYWVHNTLSDQVGNGEMLAIAEQTVPLSVHTKVSLKAARGRHLRLAPPALNKPSVRQTIGSIAGLVALVLLLPLLAFLLVRRIKELRRTRQRLESLQAFGRLATLVPRAAAAAAAAGARAGAAGWPAGSSPAGASRPARAAPGAAARRPTTSVYRTPRRLRPSVVLSVVAVLVVGGALGVVLAVAGSHVYRSSTHHETRVIGPNGRARVPLPTVPVVVLNATAVNEAAHKLSVTLQSDGVKVAGVGNVPGPRPDGVQILYAPSDHVQAQRLAAVLASQSPTLAPLDPAAAAAAGNNPQVVVVIG
jgi:polyisoprenyl-teichoic acid--peptidoglycan teichoic acid transferase